LPEPTFVAYDAQDRLEPGHILFPSVESVKNVYRLFYVSCWRKAATQK
jgi:hypothetical protein